VKELKNCLSLSGSNGYTLGGQRQGIQTTSPEYLSQFVKDHADIPTISMESVMKAAGLIESMSSQRLKLRKDRV
jgi:hypothetical protein